MKTEESRLTRSPRNLPMRRLSHVPSLLALALALAAAGTSAVQAQGRPIPDHDHGRFERFRTERYIEVFDTDGSGTVSLDEIVQEQRRLILATDVDGDGKLSVEEFRRRGHLFQMLRATSVFDMLDANGDRELTAEEIAAPSQRWFSRYDANSDGGLDADEIPVGRSRR